MNLTFLRLPSVLLALVAGCLAHAGVTLTETELDGATAYQLENDRVVLTIAPGRGAAVTSYRDKLGDNVELVPNSKYAGFCLDHFQSQSWPGELLTMPYEAKVVEKSDAKVVITCTRTASGTWNDKTNDKLTGIVVAKTYTLTADSPALTCSVTLTAPKNASKSCAYWQQTVAYPSGKFERPDDLSYRPSTRGVRVKNSLPGGNGITGNEDFLSDASDGWIGYIDRKTHNGYVVLADYNQIRYLYCNVGANTVETMFLPTYLPAGKSSTYVLNIVPLAGMPGVVAASPDYVAGYTMTTDHQGSGKLELSLVRSVNPPAPVTVELSIHSVLEKVKPVTVGPLAFNKPGDKPQTQEAAFTGAGVDPLAIDGVATTKPASGEPRVHRFNEYFNGSYKWGENITTDMASPVYSEPRPPQKLEINKPAKLSLRFPTSGSFWYIEGLGDDDYRILSSIRLSNPEWSLRVRDKTTVKSSSFGTELSDFPYDYEKLLGYTVIIIGGARADSFGQIGMTMLKDFVDAGGTIVMLGGPVAYGRSGFAGTPVADFLPVTFKEDGKGLVDVGVAPIEVVEPDNELLLDVDFSERPCVRYVHEVEVKPEAKVLLRAAGKPLLVVQEIGPRHSRIACWLAPAMGTVKPGKGHGPGFWDWDGYLYINRNLFWWGRHYDSHFSRY